MNIKSSKIRSFSLGYCKDKNGLNKIKNILEKEKYDLIHIHMMLDIDWDIVNLLKNKYRYIVSLHDYYYICPRIIMVDCNGQVCDKYDYNKCNNCISKIETFDTFRRGINKICTSIGITPKYPKIKQKVTSIRYLKLKELLENAELVLPVSNRVKEIYMNSGIEAKYKVLHIGNYSANSYKKFDPNKYVIKEDINLVVLGALTYHKGAEVLLKILERITNKNIKIHFYGRADKNYLQKLKDKGLIYHGKYSPNELNKILKNMDLGLVLSIWEDNAPQVVMELLNNNVPVIGTRRGGIPDFVSTNNGYLFNPNSQLEINKVADFLNCITVEQIIKLKQNIKRTKTAEEHLRELDLIYKELIKFN